MIQFSKAYVLTAIIFFALDYVWLTRIANDFYRRQIGTLLLDQPKLGAAGLFYVFYVAGIVFFAVLPALRDQSWTAALFAGALFGALAYGTYDMTNYATLKNWPLAVVFADIAWGTTLTGISALAGYALSRAIGG